MYVSSAAGAQWRESRERCPVRLAHAAAPLHTEPQQQTALADAAVANEQQLEEKVAAVSKRAQRVSATRCTLDAERRRSQHRGRLHVLFAHSDPLPGRRKSDNYRFFKTRLNRRMVQYTARNELASKFGIFCFCSLVFTSRSHDRRG